MRLFVSYARVDKAYCIQIVETLDVHDVWYDQRLYAGQDWWKEIMRRLDWCEGFVYLLSPDSVESQYCRREYELAASLGRHIFPVLIQEGTPLHDSLLGVQYVDLSKGLTPESVRTLLNSIYIAERDRPSAAPRSTITPDDMRPPALTNGNPASVISIAAAAMEKGQFDQAYYLLKQARASGYSSKFIDLDSMLADAEQGLERQAYLREADREYRQIVELVKYQRTRKLGCQAFQAFTLDYPEYDPDGLSGLCEEVTVPAQVAIAQGFLPAPVSLDEPFELPLLEWCTIPEGIVSIEELGKTGHRERKPYFVDQFEIAKYPVTIGQYQAFLDDPMGYANLGWWQFSPHAHSWRMSNPQSKAPEFSGEDHPRDSVNWYDALAFAHWLSSRFGTKVTLPTELQWQRAAQGDDARIYPWGDVFDAERCNTRESNVQKTTPVTAYPAGASPFGVFDLIGNVWEWCLNTKGVIDAPVDLTANVERAVHGGSYVSAHQRSQIGFRYYLNPQTYYGSIGFRLVKVV